MAAEIWDAGEPIGPLGGGKPKGGRTHQRWHRACLDAWRRTEIHSRKPGEQEAFVYIMRDANGLIKIGCTGSVHHRIAAMHSLVPFERRPIRLVRAIRIERELAFTVEKTVHCMLAAHALGKEWFAVTAYKAGRTLNRAIEAALDQQRIGKPITRAWLRRAFGSPHGR